MTVCVQGDVRLGNAQPPVMPNLFRHLIALLFVVPNAFRHLVQ
ncbi:hypothetical protein HRbin20_01241 [bacterium HR20]|jgi:hypothetical protein|nr:hypothetical protein HRbin20_01241 [bacterium HR20]GIV55749.1 MAG: hypothetical protein KatS3mg040_0517 [Candidatus Kapabacteria bacterium]